MNPNTAKFRPKGTADNSPAFQRWARSGAYDRSRRDGRKGLCSRPSLRDIGRIFNPSPSLKTLGYSHSSLRDVTALFRILHRAPDGKMPSSMAGETPAATG